MSPNKSSPISQHHAIFTQKMSEVSRESVPVVYLVVNDRPVMFNSLLDYYLAYPGKSITWKRNVARSIGLFWDYCHATKNDASMWREGNAHRRVFRQFSYALLNGTISPSTHKDVMGLYWPPSSFEVAKKLTSALAEFIAWCNDEGIIDSSIPKDIRPESEATTLTFLHKALQIKNYSFFAHLRSAKAIADRLKTQNRSQIVDLGASPLSGDSLEGEGLAFPKEFIQPLLEYGFVIDEDANDLGDREDITAKLITLLLLFGGTRTSEPFHMWFNDVVPESDGSCKVFLRHPSEAKTYLHGEGNKLRKQYLVERNLTPRNQSGNSKSYYSGWKSLALDRSLSAPIFFVHSGAEHLFRELYLYYLRYRARLMKIRDLTGLPPHPFLFVSKGLDANSGKDYSGEPYSISAYQSAYERALSRTEKKLQIKIPRGKNAGTTLHGLRHWYGRALEEIGMSTKVIQKCLRHRSPLSQGVYTTPSHERVIEELNIAREKISQNRPDLLEHLIDEK